MVQKNRLKPTPEAYRLIKAMSWHSARLYNVGLYSVRQYFFLNHEYLNYSKNYHQCKDNENYRLLLSDTAQQILRLVERNFYSFFGLLNLKKAGKYSDKVRMPYYKKKDEHGIITIQGRSARIRGGNVLIGFSKEFKESYQPQIGDLRFKLPKPIQVKKLQEVRIIPIANGLEFDIEFVYKKMIEEVEPLDPTRHVSLDMGLDNFVTCFDSTNGSSMIIDGRYIKSINQRYNHNKAHLQSIADRQGYHTTRRMLRLSRKRQDRINDYFNRTVKFISDYCVKNNIGTLIVGDFSDIKQCINLGRRTNQNFVQIPYGKFRQKLQSKCNQVGIAYHAIEESYTSKCSFLDGEDVQKHERYLGKRINRGLFRTATNRTVNADVNGAGNILVKFLTRTNRLSELIKERVVKGFVNNPVRVKFDMLLNSSSKAPAIPLCG